MKRITYETFLAVARLRHFRKAAEHLNTTQSNVSSRIASLEFDIGGKLFQRQSQAITLTPLGRELVPLAEDVLARMDSFMRAAGTNPDHEGTLRLTLSETVANLLLPEFMAKFAMSFPKASVDITVDSTTIQRQHLLDRTADLALLMGPISEYEVSNLPLIDLPMLWAVAPDHPAVEGGKLTLAHLSKDPILTFARNSRPCSELRESLQSVGIRRPQFFSSNALSATIGMTKAGLGISTLPEVFARPFLEAGEIVQVESPIDLNDLRFTASYINDSTNALAKAAARIAVDVAADLAN